MSWGEHHRLQIQQLRLLEEIRDLLRRVVALLGHQATTATLSISGGSPMATLTLNFVDNSGNDQAAPTGDGSGLVVTFATDGTSTVGAAVEGTNAAGFVNYTTEITDADDGTTSNLSAVVANTSGVALLDDDGTTPFVQPEPVVFTASSAPPVEQATTATLTISE